MHFVTTWQSKENEDERENEWEKMLQNRFSSVSEFVTDKLHEAIKEFLQVYYTSDSFVQLGEDQEETVVKACDWGIHGEWLTWVSIRAHVPQGGALVIFMISEANKAFVQIVQKIIK